MRNRAKIIAFCSLSMALMLGACSSRAMEGRNVAEAGEVPQWPPPPKAARIIFQTAIREPYDFGFKRTFPQKVWDIVAGKAMGTEFGSPYAVALGPEGLMAVTDTARGSVYVFDPVKGKYKIIHRAGKERILSPVGAAFNAGGELYVSDSAAKKIYVFDAKRKFVKSLGGPDTFQRPTGLAFNKSNDTLYVVDTLASQIIALAPNGSEKMRFGSNGIEEGQLNVPTQIAVFPTGELVVNDSMNFRVQAFDKDGKFIAAFGHQGDGTGDFARPRGIAVDSSGHIYIADALFDVVQIFDRDGKYLLSFGGTGGYIGQMFMPAGIAIDKDDRIIVVDQGNRRLQTFRYVPLPEGGAQ